MTEESSTGLPETPKEARWGWPRFLAENACGCVPAALSRQQPTVVASITSCCENCGREVESLRAHTCCGRTKSGPQPKGGA